MQEALASIMLLAASHDGSDAIEDSSELSRSIRIVVVGIASELGDAIRNFNDVVIEAPAYDASYKEKKGRW